MCALIISNSKCYVKIRMSWIQGVPQGFRSLWASNTESEPGLALVSKYVHWWWTSLTEKGSARENRRENQGKSSHSFYAIKVHLMKWLMLTWTLDCAAGELEWEIANIPTSAGKINKICTPTTLLCPEDTVLSPSPFMELWGSHQEKPPVVFWLLWTY